MTRHRLSIAFLVIAVLGPLAGLLWFESRLGAREARRPEVGAVFPGLPGLTNGETLPAAQGRRRLVTFARKTCPACKRTLASFRRLAEGDELRFDQIVIMAGASHGATDVVAGESRMTRIIPDADGSLSERFGVLHVPLVFLVDENSRIQASATGDRPETAWRTFLEARDGAH